MSPIVSVIIPMYNEEDNVLPLFERLFAVLAGLEESSEVIVIDDGSTDGTRALLECELASRPDLALIERDENAGQHAAILAGFRRARGDWLVTLDADLQNPPEEIPRLVDALRAGHDHVGTYRENRQDTMFRRASSAVVNRCMRRLARTPVRDLGCMLRGYSAELARTIAEEATPDAFITILGYRRASNPIEVGVGHEARAGGQSKYGFRGLLKLGAGLARTTVRAQRIGERT